MKKCKNCNQKFKPDNPLSRNQKFCKPLCRTRFYYKQRGGAKYQKNYYARRLKEKYAKEELIQCKFCGRYFRQVGTHVVQTHKYESAREYREEYGFDVKRGQLPEDYRELKAQLAKEKGGIKNLKKGCIYWFKKGDTTIGIYKRSKQTLERLKSLYKKRKNVKIK